MSDATPAYRGYRLQALYTLARILEPAEEANLVFQPEGAEDLAILDSSDHLLEAVQVKAYSSNLTLSLLAPEKVDSFLYRVNALLRSSPELKISIASFGEIGPELLHATQANGSERTRIAQKIGDYGFLSEADARRLIAQVQILSVEEAGLEERVFALLRNLCVGIDPIPAFEMLNFWLYGCAESKHKISQSDVIQRINDVGRFLAERAAHHSEWFTSIVPIQDDEVENQEREALGNEFYRGISARYQHILAGVDKPRLTTLNEIAQKFRKNQVVIIHGASGQGKTTLAYRYLHDFFPEHWRFQVRLVQSRQQALNIATALSGQAKAIGIPMVVYLDVSPSDTGWVELVKQLSTHRSIQVLVTVREEDFSRASVSGAELQFSEIGLQFDRSAAEEIYQFLVETETPAQFLDFGDAWNRFGGGGPLMEFVYLVTQGDSLRERLRQQVRRIQDEVRSEQRSDAELELLRLVSVASAFEARLKVRELIRSIGLTAPQRTLELLENEYLLRTSENGTLVEGLHPIRSAILSDILTDPTFFPWTDSASACLPFVFEQDVGSFLLYAFSRHQSELDPLLQALDLYQPCQWVAIAGVSRALIWLGIKEYVETNEQLIADAYQAVTHGWAFVLNFDIADASPESTEVFGSTLAPLISEDGQAQIAAFRNRQTASSQVFVRVARWLTHLTQEPIPPQTALDWIGMAEVLFWLGRLQVTLPIRDWLAHVDLAYAVETLSLEILADLALGLFYGYEAGYRVWLNENHARIISRFRQETQTVVWEDDGRNLRSHFAIELFQPDALSSDAQPNQADTQRGFIGAAVERLELCRRLFPDRERYGSQGYGHRLWSNTEFHDETEKNIPQANFPLPWLVSLNATFKALGEQHLRPGTWEEYARIVLELRQTIVQVLQQLKQGLEIYFRQQQTTRILGESVESNLWTLSQQRLQRSPWLPRCAFDEWGFATENSNRSNESTGNDLSKRQNLALEKYNPYLKAFNEYTRTFSNFLEQAGWVLNFQPYLRSGENARLQELVEQLNINLSQKAQLSVVNLGDAWQVIPELQVEFRKLLSQFVDVQELDHLERSEQATLKELWCSWYFFAFHPNRRFQNATWECTRLFNDQVRAIKRNISRELRRLSQNGLRVNLLSEDVLWEESRTLWLVIDGTIAFDVYAAVERTIAAIRRAIHAVQSSELRRYAIDFTWQNIAVVPLVRGRSLDATAWRFSSILFSVDTGQELEWWNFVPVAMPSSTLLQLSLSTWTYSRLDIARKLIGLISQLSTLTSHVRDFTRLPELDEQGQELLRDYIQRLAAPMGEVFQSVLDVEVEVGSYFNELSPPEQINRPNLFGAMQILVELHEQILPAADCRTDGRIETAMNLEQVAEWATRLDTVKQTAFLMYLFWASDVLEEAEVIRN